MSDIVERLSEMASLEVGSPFPAWLVDERGNWAGGMRNLLTEAADEISRLRRTAGEPTGPSFRELKHTIITPEFSR